MSRHNISYYFREGFKGVFSHGFMSFAAVSVMTTCLVLTGTVVLLVLTLNLTIDSMTKIGDIHAYVDDTYTIEEAAELEEKIRAIDNVSGVDFIDRNRRLDELKVEWGKENAYLLEGLEYDNPLRDTYRIWVKHIDDYTDTINAIQDIRGIAEVDAAVKAINELRNIRAILGGASIAFLAMLGLVSIFLIANTIKLASFDRREEIAIMKMIGATNTFVRMPFVVESIILSLISAGAAFGLQWLISDAIAASGLANLSFIELASFTSFRIEYAVAFLAISLFLGVIGSALSIRKFLRV